MISYKIGIVDSIIKDDDSITLIYVNIDNSIFKAVNYKDFTGDVQINDVVVLNTTAIELNLGTGGNHFVVFNYKNKSKDLEGNGHIMKLRYTPLQLRCLVAEEQESPYHNIFNEFKSLDNHICIVATLHSMIAPIIAMIKFINKNVKINYIMTDGGALPISFSNTIKELKNKKMLDKTITMGHAFGGDLECINIYTSLIAAKEILKGDITIISMGPGIVGTGTKYGFTGMEQGYIIDAVNNLGGVPFVVPRISFKDKRDRHYGISHHTITVLSEIANTKANLVLPYLDNEKHNYIMHQIQESKIDNKHNIILQNGKGIFEAMKKFELNTTSMGRTIADDNDYFIALGAVGASVASYFMEGE